MLLFIMSKLKCDKCNFKCRKDYYMRAHKDKYHDVKTNNQDSLTVFMSSYKSKYINNLVKYDLHP